MRIDPKAALLSKVGIGVLAVLMLMGGLCRKTLGTTITVVNGTENQIRNVEVTYRGGTVGTAAIAPHQQFQKWVPAKGSCSVKVAFLNTANQPVKPLLLESYEPCATTITFTIGS